MRISYPLSVAGIESEILSRARHYFVAEGFQLVSEDAARISLLRGIWWAGFVTTSDMASLQTRVDIAARQDGYYLEYDITTLGQFAIMDWEKEYWNVQAANCENYILTGEVDNDLIEECNRRQGRKMLYIALWIFVGYMMAIILSKPILQPEIIKKRCEAVDG